MMFRHFSDVLYSLRHGTTFAYDDSNYFYYVADHESFGVIRVGVTRDVLKP